MKREFLDRKEIAEMLWDVFKDEVADLIENGKANDTHPASTIAAINGIHGFVCAVIERMGEGTNEE